MESLWRWYAGREQRWRDRYGWRYFGSYTVPAQVVRIVYDGWQF